MSEQNIDIFKLQSDAISNLQAEVSYDKSMLYLDGLDSFLIDDNFKTTWSNKKQSAYLKYVMIGLPSSFEIIRKDNNKVAILNGKNRFFAIKQFLNNKIKLNDKVYLPELNDKLFSELSSSTQSEFKSNVENIRLIVYSIKTVPLLMKTW